MLSKSRAYLILAAVGLIAFFAGRSLGTGPELVEIPEASNNSAPAPVAVPAPAPSPAPAPVAAPTPAPSPPAQQSGEQVWRVTLSPDDASKGPADAPVTVVLFTSFGCTECAAFQPALDKVFAENPGKLRVVIKHKVLPMRHPDALLSAQASLAAKAQGKFWPYYEKLVSAGNKIQRSDLEGIAVELGLDIARFKADLNNETFRAQVLRDSLLAYEVGAHSYPNILANGVRINKAKNYESLKSLVASQLAESQKLQSAGMKPENLYNARVVSGRSFPQLQPRINVFNNTGSPGLGPENAKIQVTVFEDFQCPFCARIGPSLKALHNRFPKDVRIVFKHLPLVDIHPDAMRASEASMSAHAEGKFWAFHDLLFQNQKNLSEADIKSYGQRADLNQAALNDALTNGSHRELIQRDINDAKRAGVSGTPSVFLNGRTYTGPQGYPPEGLEAVARAHLGL